MLRGTFLLLLAAGTLGTGTLSAQQAHVNLDWDPHRNREGLAPFGANLVSPEVTDDRRVIFRLRAPEARSVALGGAALLLALGSRSTPVPFERDEEGLWTLTVGPLDPNIYSYRLVVDGLAVVDPNNTVVVNADQPGYNLLVVHGGGPRYYDARPVPHGAITRHVYQSDVTSGARELYVYTPPNYNPSIRYPVLYLLGGSGEVASNWHIEGRAGFIADNLIADGQALPMIIAMPNNQVLHRMHPRHTELTFDLFEQDLRQHIIPLVDSQYSTRATPSGRAIAGLSMGGRHAQLIGFKSLDLFRSFGILSAGDPQSETSTPGFLRDPDINRKVAYLFVGLGTYENLPTNRSVVFHEILEKHRVEHDYYIGGNSGHDFLTWRDHLLHMLPRLWRREPEK